MKTSRTHYHGRSWIDIARQYGGSSASYQRVPGDFNLRHHYPLFIRNWAVDGRGVMWISNRYKMIPSKLRGWRWPRLARGKIVKINIKWPDYVSSDDGTSFGTVTFPINNINAIEVDWWNRELGGYDHSWSVWNATQVFSRKIPDATSNRLSRSK